MCEWTVTEELICSENSLTLLKPSSPFLTLCFENSSSGQQYLSTFADFRGKRQTYADSFSLCQAVAPAWHLGQCPPVLRLTVTCLHALGCFYQDDDPLAG